MIGSPSAHPEETTMKALSLLPLTACLLLACGDVKDDTETPGETGDSDTSTDGLCPT